MNVDYLWPSELYMKRTFEIWSFWCLCRHDQFIVPCNPMFFYTTCKWCEVYLYLPQYTNDCKVCITLFLLQYKLSTLLNAWLCAPRLENQGWIRSWQVISIFSWHKMLSVQRQTCFLGCLSVTDKGGHLYLTRFVAFEWRLFSTDRLRALASPAAACGSYTYLTVWGFLLFICSPLT